MTACSRPPKNPLAEAFPEIAAQWHPTMNGDRTPETVAATSNLSAWWQAECGHEWEARIANRTHRKSRCPYCFGKAVLVGVNDLATTHRSLSEQWHPTRNGDLTPREVKAGSQRQAWWRGDCGHEWQAAIKDRALKGSGCPFCLGKATLAGFNDLATTHRSLSEQWHPTRNGDLTPRDIRVGYRRNVWWLAPCGHEWEATPASRQRGPRCPVCTGHRILVGVNDLATTHRGLSEQWHPALNGSLTPQQVTAGSNKKAWWLGACGHEWDSFIHDRAGKRETGCPRCANHVSKGESELHDALVAHLPSSAWSVERNTRPGRGAEIDLLVRTPDGASLAIEFNGVFWHSEKFRGADYHRAKREAILAAGHRFIAVWEDDWRHRRQVVVQSILHRMGLTDVPANALVRTGARNLQPGPVSATAATQFLDHHHMQGAPPPSHRHLGLYDAHGTLRSVLSVRSRGGAHAGEWEIVRFASAGTVAGAFTRLLAYAERTWPQIRVWVTFADHSVSDGDLYSASGFVADKVLRPDYTYAGNRNGWVREHKFNYRIKRFREDPALTYVDGLTERQLAELNGLVRVWDYGKTRYVKTVGTR